MTDGFNATEIANQLNQEDVHPPRHHTPFKAAGVLQLMRRLGIYQRQPKGVKTESLTEHKWWLPDLARTLEAPDSTLYKWVKRRWLQYRKQSVSPYRLIISADEVDIQKAIS
ncbi:site-specific dna invertase pin [Leptolyngbya sp. Heron Island J]|uniref:hypothetical protein n=1 Tax=Leptolyngbya sp. Heron Island J TaxID=1385935 RepID=UPI0003B9DA6D|nr:hypothetical protein [Leptolyngbya sp. Heron Island J]ESA38728.1 site-specific dna invertase pin [Leptolyngbya sp. Heron Island J]